MHPYISLMVWKPGDLVWYPPFRTTGIIIRIKRRKLNEWYDVLINGRILSLMHQDFEPYTCKLTSDGV